MTGPELLGVRQPEHYLHRMLHTTWIYGHRRLVIGARVVERTAQSVGSDDGARAAGAETDLDIARALDACQRLSGR
jgi:hypothetical protein